jgi:hypothetical protein
MKMRHILAVCTAAGLGLGLAALTGCGGGGGSDKKDGDDGKKKPVFTLAWSEYPSWSLFGVASDLGLINGKEGELGELEKKWGVDIKLALSDYDSCINAYQGKQADAACITNTDILAPALTRKSVAILPTSTSYGADACLITSAVKDIDDLKNHKVYGLQKSVSEYAFGRVLKLEGKNEADYTFAGMDPDKAADGMRNKVKEIQSIMVWNPYVLQTLKSRSDTKRLFDSTKIPEEIIDMVIIGDDVLNKPGGKEFACCIIDCYYEFCKRLEDSKDRDKLLVALGEKFSNLDLDGMKKAVDQTRFYKTPADALTLLEGEGKLSKRKFPETMKIVVDFYTSHKFIDKAPTIGYGTADEAKDVNLRFDTSYIKQVRDKK